VTGAAATTFPDGLRAVAVDPTAMRGHADEVEADARVEPDPSRRAQLLGRAGYLAGVLRELDRAERLLTEALELASATDQPRRVVVLRLRLADVHALGGDPDRAEHDLTGSATSRVAVRSLGPRRRPAAGWSTGRWGGQSSRAASRRIQNVSSPISVTNRATPATVSQTPPSS
jgi:hypothetical protein